MPRTYRSICQGLSLWAGRGALVPLIPLLYTLSLSITFLLERKKKKEVPHKA